METEKSNAITTRIFVGVEMTSEVKMRLSHSHLWKDAQLVSGKNPGALKEIQYQNKSYVGRTMPYKEVTIKDLDGEITAVIQALSEYNPQLKIDKNNAIIFPQVFIA